MPPLDDKWFGNQRDLLITEVLELEAASLGYPVQAVLGKNGWDGTLVVGFGLELSGDNDNVRRGQVVMRGPLSSEPAQIQASKLWEKAGKDVMVSITFPQAAEFDFTAGTMASEYLGGECVKMVCSKEDRVILPADWATHGITASCFRVILYLDKTSNTRCGPTWRYVVLFFPSTIEQLMEMSADAKGPAWPGIKVLEGQAGMFPVAAANTWGCPVLPIICPGTKFMTLAVVPSGAKMRYEISRIAGTARTPIACASFSTLRRKWRAILEDTDRYSESLPMVTWPEEARPAADMGEFEFHFLNSTKTHTQTQHHTQ